MCQRRAQIPERAGIARPHHWVSLKCVLLGLSVCGGGGGGGGGVGVRGIQGGSGMGEWGVAGARCALGQGSLGF